MPKCEICGEPPPTEISSNGLEIWDWAGRLSDRAHLVAELNQSRKQLHNALNTCGSCSHWMTKSCPRETHDSKTGRIGGPSSGAIKCEEFVMSPLNASSVALAEAKIAELEKRLQEERPKESL